MAMSTYNEYCSNIVERAIVPKKLSKAMSTLVSVLPSLYDRLLWAALYSDKSFDVNSYPFSFVSSSIVLLAAVFKD